jgi:two-component system chemotaxis sensor kinase CheA
MNDDSIDRDELLRVFLAEAEEILSTMEESLVALESAPDDDERIATVFRAAHTLKGNCAMLGLDATVALAHAAEDLLDGLRQHHFAVTRDLITLLLRTADALKTLIPRSVAHPDAAPQPEPELVEALRRAAATGRYEVASKKRAAGGEAGETAAATTTVRVHTRKLDALLNAVSELNITRGRVRALAPSGRADLDDTLDHLDHLVDLIQDLVLQTRMVPIGPVFRQQVRTARDLATRVGKQVAVEISGEDVELDTSVIERLRDPLTHMIRNAVDHGIESPELRRARGKSAAATIGLRASHHDGMIVVEVADDGAGLDLVRLRERARVMGIDAGRLSDREVLRLILVPGFSTAREVTEVSGRGIGLDIVEKNVSAIGGAIGIESEMGRGTTFTIRLPLTFAVLHGLSARIGPELYIVPLPAVSECLDMPAENGSAAESGVFTLRGDAVPFLRLRGHFASPGHAADIEKVIVVEYGRNRVGLVVDELIGETRAVVKPMSRFFRRSGWISGSALLGSGEIGLVLEVASILDDVAARRPAQHLGA